MRDTTGATSIEYAMIASLVSIMIVLGVTTIGSTLKNIFTNLASKL